MKPEDKQILSPFKFLSAYTEDDKDLFFGRDTELLKIKDLIVRSNLLLVYGPSGSGKTSVVQCGFSKIMQLTDYYPLAVRRETNIIIDTLNALLVNLEAPTLNELPVEQSEIDKLFGDCVRELANTCLRPIYLIYDQFEELFQNRYLLTQAESDKEEFLENQRKIEQEQLIFFKLIRSLYYRSVPCKVFLIMREDYIAHLYKYEEQIPILFDYRMRIEPMSSRKLESVINKTFEKHNSKILLDSPRDENIQHITDATLLSGNNFQLSYLQVYLDQVWRKGQLREKSNEGQIIIDKKLLNQIGQFDDVMDSFIQERKLEIKTHLKRHKPVEDDNIYSESINKVFEEFITEEGHRRRLPVDAPIFSDYMGSEIVKQLVAFRIVLPVNNQFELVHDSIASVIDRGRSFEQRQINELVRLVKISFDSFKRRGKPEDQYLSLAELNDIDRYEKYIPERLTVEENDYIKESKNFIEKQSRKQNRLLEDLAKNIKQNQIARIFLGLLVTACIFLILLYEIASRQQVSTNVRSAAFLAPNLAPKQGVSAAYWAYTLQPNNITLQSLYQEAIRYSQYSYFKASPHPLLQSVGSIKSVGNSSDGQWFALLLNDESVKLYNQYTKKIVPLPSRYPIREVIFSPEGSTVCTASEENEITLWSHAGMILKTLRLESVIQHVVYTPDGNSLLVQTANGELRLFSLERVNQLKLEGVSLNDRIKISANSSNALILSPNGHLRLWSLQSGVVNINYPKGIISAEFSPDGRQIITVDTDSSYMAVIRDLKGNRISRLSHEKNVRLLTAKFSPDGQYVLTSTIRATVHLWDTRTKQPFNYAQLTKIKTVQFSPNSLLILITTTDKALLWDVKGLIKPLVLKEGIPQPEAIFSFDGKYILVKTLNGQVSIYNYLGSKLMTLPEDNPYAIARFTYNSRQFLTISMDGHLSLWDQDNKLTNALLLKNLVKSLSTMQASWASVLTYDNVVNLWNHSSDQLYSFRLNEDKIKSEEDKELTTGLSKSKNWVYVTHGKTVEVFDTLGKQLLHHKHLGSIVLTTFLSNNHKLLTVSSDNFARVWNLDSPESKSDTFELGKSISFVRSIPSTDELIVGQNGDNMSSKVDLFSLKTKRRFPLFTNGNIKNVVIDNYGSSFLALTTSEVLYFKTRQGFQRTINSGKNPQLIVLSESGKNALIVKENGEAIIYNTKQNLFTKLDHQFDSSTNLSEPNFKATSASFSPDGLLLCIISQDGTAWIWRTNGQFVTRLQSDDGRINTVSFSPTGDLLFLTASTDKIARLWNSEGNQIAVLKHDESVSDAKFSDNGSWIITVSANKVTRWPMPSQIPTWLQAKSITPEISEQTRQKYMIQSGIWEAMAARTRSLFQSLVN